MNSLTKRVKAGTRLSSRRMSHREKALHKSLVIWFCVLILIAGCSSYVESVKGKTDGKVAAIRK